MPSLCHLDWLGSEPHRAACVASQSPYCNWRWYSRFHVWRPSWNPLVSSLTAKWDEIWSSLARVHAFAPSCDWLTCALPSVLSISSTIGISWAEGSIGIELCEGVPSSCPNMPRMLEIHIWRPGYLNVLSFALSFHEASLIRFTSNQAWYCICDAQHR